MAFARTSLRGFLQYTKTSLANAIARGDKVTIVIGNESADLDSLTSSLVLAYVRSNAPPSRAFSRLYYPVLNIPSADIALRPEFQAVLSSADVDLRSLITLDDLPTTLSSPRSLKPENLRWILVDHNALQGELGKQFAHRVHGVIDHHEEEDKVPRDTESEPRIVEKSGSCTSLVVNYCKPSWDDTVLQSSSTGAAIAQDDTRLRNDLAYTSTWDAQIAQVALASILIDTNNLQSKDKTTKHDTEAVSYLEAKILSSAQVSKTYNRDEFFKQISTAKQDIGQLKLLDILRKDYKQWDAGADSLGISSVVKNLDFLMDKAVQEGFGQNKTEAFLAAVHTFAQDRSIGMYAIMTTSTSAKGEFMRELFLSATKPETINAACKFERDSKNELGLAEWNGAVDDMNRVNEDYWLKVWQQNEVQFSRKKIAPLLRQSFAS